MRIDREAIPAITTQLDRREEQVRTVMRILIFPKTVRGRSDFVLKLKRTTHTFYLLLIILRL